jgi:hypothetical protein
MLAWILLARVVMPAIFTGSYVVIGWMYSTSYSTTARLYNGGAIRMLYALFDI